jgi:dolichol-phosphate mannosyltransferase
MPDLGIVIPFYNEERTAEAVASSLLSTLEASGLDFELALVGDGSTDGTAAALDKVAQGDPRVQAVSGPRAEGYGAAILHGFSLLSADIIGWMDGDGQVPPGTVVEIYAAMKREGALVGMGLRQRRQDGWMRVVASRGYNWLMARSLGHRFPDINAKPKLIRRTLIQEIRPSAKDWFIDTEIVVGALARGAKIVRVPVPFLLREHGSSKVRLSILREYVGNLRRARRTLRRSRSR